MSSRLHCNDLRRQGGTSMIATVKTPMSGFGQIPKALDLSSAVFLDEDLAAIPASRIPDEFRKLTGFLPVVVLIPKSAVLEKARARRHVPNGRTSSIQGNSDIPSPLSAAMAWFKNPNTTDTFIFGDVTVSISTMETHRKGQPVALTFKEFKTLSHLIKNARRVITRDELLNEVWGYDCYPSTRTVDNHMLRLRQKLESEPARPKHLLTVHGVGYKFVP
jgi:DNA-binding winged helix-turn-helix (wHTH) protein